MNTVVVPVCVACQKPCTDRYNDPQTFYYESEPMCGKCYHSLICVYCDPPLVLSKCNGHSIGRNPNNRFMKDKEFIDGMRFEYESERHLPPGTRPRHVRSK